MLSTSRNTEGQGDRDNAEADAHEMLIGISEEILTREALIHWRAV